MNISVTIIDFDSLQVQYRAESPDHLGDGLVVLREGDDFLGIPFDTLKRLGDGSYETDDIEEVKS